MDVEMERQGLPTAFSGSPETEQSMHEAANLIASSTNAGAGSLASLKPTAQPESSDAVTTSVPAETAQPVLPSTEVLVAENGVRGASVNGNHVSEAQTSGPFHLEDASSIQQSSKVPVESSIIVSTVSQPVATASTPTELSVLPNAVTESATEVNTLLDIHTEPTPPPQQPISDLRSLPQTEVKEILYPTAETIESALPPQTESSTLPHQPVEATETRVDTQAAVSIEPVSTPLEIARATETELPTPPVPSPPTSTQIAEASQPQDQEMIDAPVVTSSDASPLPAEPSTSAIAESYDTAKPPPPPEPMAQQPLPEDQMMMDANDQAQAKIAREREDDHDESEPAAKRAKTESDETFKVPDAPSATQPPTATNGNAIFGEDDTITPARLAHMKKIISNLKKGNSSTAFRIPVDWVALNIPTYPDVVKEPMDLGTIDTKLKNKAYAGVSGFINDFNLVVNNSYIFNGRDHVVSQQAAKMEASFNNQIKLMPAANLVEPSKEEKKLQRPKVEPVRQAPPRRQSMNTGSARSPSATTNSQTFALGPEGVPLIRRDSNVNDGRAKRAVIPPKRHSDFAGRPKKKKYELELKFCSEVLKELQSTKHYSFASLFYSPVDPVALNIPTYYQIIKKPMDLGTIQSKLENNAYEKASEFKDDCQLIFKNCFKFNPEGDWVNGCGHQLEDVFNKKWETKDDWIASRQPDSEPHSAAEEEDEEDEEASEADDDSEDDRNNKIMLLQKQIEMMGKQMVELTQPKKKKKSTPPMPVKKTKGKADKKEKATSTKAKKEEAPAKKKPKKVKEEKERFVTYNEKQYISNGISQLPDKLMGEALKLIQQNVPSLKTVEETEIELDIDELPNPVLLQLLKFVEKSGGGPLPPTSVSEVTYVAPAATSGKPKKNKPMGKSEQEAQIAELKGKLENFSGDGLSPNALPSIENDADSSGDEGSDSEESEEE